MPNEQHSPAPVQTLAPADAALVGSGVALEVIPPRSAERGTETLANVMASLCRTVNQPITLEIAGTADARRFLLRAPRSATLSHLARQIQARYPQAALRPLAPASDPFHLAPSECVTGVELRAGAAPYLPLKSWDDASDSRLPEGADPLLGLLAAFGGLGQLPAGTRAITQLALLPAAETWSAPHLRLAVEHPLEPERARERQEDTAARQTGGSTLSIPVVIGLLGLVLLLLVVQRDPSVLPLWVRQAGQALLHGKPVRITPKHLHALQIAGGALLGGLALLLLMAAWLRTHLRGWLARTPLYDQRLVQQKTAQPAYAARLYLLVIGPEAGRQDHVALLEDLTSAYRQFHLATGAYFVPRRLRPRAAQQLIERRHPDWYPRIWYPHFLQQRAARPGWQRGLRRHGQLLSTSDVASLWHLPQAADIAEVPFVEHTGSRTLLVPAALARPGCGAQIGTSTHAGHTLPVCLPPDALRRNALAIAKTGKGKSTLLLALGRAALEAGHGLLVVDPHGDLAETLLTLVPESRRDDVVLVDFGDGASPVTLNPLDVALYPERDKAVANTIAVLGHIWHDFWGPRMESPFAAALRTLYEANTQMVRADPQDGPTRQFTLLDVTPLVRDEAFRHAVLASVPDPLLHEYWRYFDGIYSRLQQDAIMPITTKLDQYTHAVSARRVVGVGRSTLDLAEALQQERIVLVKTAQGILGPDLSGLLGATLLGLMQMTVAEQARVSAHTRSQLRVIVDEFQTLRGVDFGAMLSELRKFGASFALATQALAHLDALDPLLRPTVLANTDQLFAFAMSADDARTVERELDSGVEYSDLTALDDFTCYARLTVEGHRVPVFSLKLAPPSGAVVPSTTTDPIADMRERSRTRYAIPAEKADDLIRDAAIRRRLLVEQQVQRKPGKQTPDVAGDEHPAGFVAPETTGLGTAGGAPQQGATAQARRAKKAARTRKKSSSSPNDITVPGSSSADGAEAPRAEGSPRWTSLVDEAAPQETNVLDDRALDDRALDGTAESAALDGEDDEAS